MENDRDIRTNSPRCPPRGASFWCRVRGQRLALGSRHCWEISDSGPFRTGPTRNRSRSACCTRSAARWRSAKCRCGMSCSMAVEEINAKGGRAGTPDESWSSSTRLPIGTCLRKRPNNCWCRIRWQSSSAAGRRSAVNPSCRCLKKTTACSLSRAVRGRRMFPQRVLHRGGGQSAGRAGR